MTMQIIRKTYFLIIFLTVSYISSGQSIKENVSESLDISQLFDTENPVIQVKYDKKVLGNLSAGTDVAVVVSDNSGISRVVIGEKEYDASSEIIFEKILKLPNDYRLNVTAYDIYDNEANYQTQILLKDVSPVEDTVPKTGVKEHKFYALIIGINEYSDKDIVSLDEPINDATKLKDILVRDYTFEEENITFLKNPINEDIHVAFEKINSEITPDDFLLIFYAGHGYFDEGTSIGYWLPANAKMENTARWFRNSTLVENIAAINSKHTLLIADACFSGGIFKTRAAINNANLNIANMLKRPSRKAMTSGSLTTVPDKSVFMKYLLKILNENNNKYLPSEDLFYDLALRMKSNSDTRPMYGEINNAGDEGGNFIFIKRD